MSEEEGSIDTGGGTHVSRDVHVEGGGDFVGRDKIVYSRSEREELESYLALAVAKYEGGKSQAVRRLPTRFDDPYKFLDAFGLEDKYRFFGRDDAQQKLYDKVLQDRLTVVHAKSGAGKTSLLNAGLAPRLIDEGRLPVYARAYQEPVRAIKQAITAHTPGPWPALLSKLTLREFLGMACERLGEWTQELVLMLDQFEEFFIFFPERAHRKPFIDELADCYHDAALPLRIVLALRKDYYSDLADFEERIPTIFGSQVRLDAMTREEARAAITEPLTRLDRPVEPEPALVEALLDDLARGGMELPHLQILCTQLWRELEDGGTRITLASYEALGQAAGILTGYLKGELAKLPGGQGPLAREVLKELVSSDATKRVLGHTMLAARIEGEAEELDRVLAWLVNRRLLHREEVEGEIRYEMAHEYLIEEIREWIEPADLAFKQAQELLAGEVATWRRSGRTLLIPRDRLALLYAQRERLRGLDDESWACILHSAMQADFALMDWVRLAGEAGEKPLLAILGAADGRTRRAATRGLGVIWSVEEVSRLGDEDPRIRRWAAEALGELGDAHAVEPLIAALGDEEHDVYVGAARTLGALGDPRAVAPLIAALQKDEWAARMGAAEALGVIGDPCAVAPLIAALGDEDDHVRQAAAVALAKLGEPAVEPLVATLGDEDGHVRRGAARALGELGDAHAVAPVVAALGDEDGGVRQEATGALAKLGDPAVEPLIDALQDEDDRVRKGAAGALGKLGAARAVAPLIAALGDEDGDVRQGAAGALGELGDPQAVAPLIAILGDEDGHVWWGAARALGRLGEPAVAPLIAILGDEDGSVRWGAARALGALGDRRAVAPLIAALRDREADVRHGVARALERLGDPRAVEPLIAALGDKVRHVRWAAASALGGIGDRRAVDPLMSALGDETVVVRHGAAEALGKLGDPCAVEPLIAALGDEDGRVRQGAAVALGNLGNMRAVESLIAALGDKDGNVRQRAVWALVKLGEPAVGPLIAAFKNEDNDLRALAAIALGVLGEPAVEPLIAALRDEDWRVRQGVAGALGKLGDPRAVEPLILSLRDESGRVRQGAAEALVKLSDAPTVKRLIDALREEDREMRQAATWALESIGTPEALAALDEAES
jgi:HEAT repeat protein